MSDGEELLDRHKGRRRPGWPAVAAACLILFLVLVLPNRPDALTLDALTILPLELPVIAALLLAPLAGSWRMAVRVAIMVFLGAAIVLKLADFGLFTAFNRPFNLAFDLPLLHAGWLLFTGSSGALVAKAYVGAALVVLLLVVGLIWWATGIMASAGGGPRPRALAAALLAGGAVAAAAIGIGSATTARLAGSHAGAVLQAARDIAALEAEAAADDAEQPGDAFLPALKGRDVILAFVESYGRSTHDNPLYASTTRAALTDVEADLRRRGLAMRSAWLTSPVVGGQSWLAHATLLSGLWIDNQGRYDALLRSRRPTLISLAAAAGRHAVAVMPAITMPWPESAWFGYSEVYAAADLGYRGLPFNWVTMPDQYTWSALERLELDRTDRAPLLGEVALISSHAPWTPIPKLVPWEEVGDGTVFDAQAASGDPPEVVWRDQARIRDHFGRTIDYALRTVGSFAARHAEDPPLLIVLGDHQPVVFVSGSETVHDVPIHIIGDPESIAHLDGWEWTDGLLPSANAPVWRMDSFRNRLLDAFSDERTAPDAEHGPV